MHWTLFVTLLMGIYQPVVLGQTDNTIRRRLESPYNVYKTTTRNETASAAAAAKSTCAVCRVREDLKNASLEHIKSYVLFNLGLEHPPNFTNIPRVPDFIFAKYYNITTEARNPFEDENMMADEAVATSAVQYYPSTVRVYILSREAREPLWVFGGQLRGQSRVFTLHHHRFVQKSQRRININSSEIILANKFMSIELIHWSHESSRVPITLSTLLPPCTVAKTRYNKKLPDVLYFRISSINHLLIHRAIFMIYIRGEMWIKRHMAHESGNLTPYPLNITLTVNRIVRSQIQPSDVLHSRVEASITVPLDPDMGATYAIDITQLVIDWHAYPDTNNGLFLRTKEPWMRQLLLLEDPSGRNVPFLEIVARDKRNHRHKRSTNLICRENDNESRCCRYPLVVDFDKFGWDWVIAPKQYDANYCSGECSINFLTRYGHTHVMQLASSAQACCSPRKMAPLTLLYFNPQEQIVHTTLQNMIVQMCTCS
ncbi:uncharacterized protein DMENIID0001_163350 [Sergentomyia squamirostris]